MTMLLFVLVEITTICPTTSFRISTISPRPTSGPIVLLGPAHCKHEPSLSFSPVSPPVRQPIVSPIVLYSAEQQDNNDDSTLITGISRSSSLGGILGSIASIVVLRSEFVLKTTGCGLPAGPFGIVGAVEGLSYLGVVATCLTTVIGYFSTEDAGSSGGENKDIATTVATALSFTAVGIGVAVLAFQLTDYGYIPNAVPMEGGMCK